MAFMKCTEVRADIIAFLKGELSPSDVTALETHVKECATCQKEVHGWQHLLSLLQAAPEMTPGPQVWKRITERLAEVEKAQERRLIRRQWWFIASAAAAVVLVLATFFFISRNVTPPIKPPPEYTVTQHYERLDIRGVGTLRLAQGSVYRLDGRTLFLKQGEVIADINPSGKGFVVQTDAAKATVKGTKFGVKAERTHHQRTLLYVLRGEVELASDKMRQLVKEGTAIFAEEGKSQFEWLKGDSAQQILTQASRAFDPVAELAIDKSEFSREDGVTFTLTIKNESAWPMLLEPLIELEPDYVMLRLVSSDGTIVYYSLRSEMVASKNVPPRPANARWELKSHESCQFICLLRANFFPMLGRYQMAVWAGSGIQSHQVEFVVHK